MRLLDSHLREQDGVKMLKVLDLFCGAGGASMGYFRAGLHTPYCYAG
jgi:hypothetical protein